MGAGATGDERPSAPGPLDDPTSDQGPELSQSVDVLYRCEWAGSDPLMIAYHDEEWGVPCHDDRDLFERLILEGFQAGLSWSTILRKRQAFIRAFDGFDPEIVARYGPDDVARLLDDAGIVRNRLKVAAAISNAQAFLETRDEFGTFDAYIWQFAPDALGPRPRSPGGHSGDDAGIRRHEQRSEAARVSLRRQHDLLRLHAECRSRR